jgi:hypothetical protein
LTFAQNGYPGNSFLNDDDGNDDDDDCCLIDRYTFDYHPGEVYWCTADIGWITGHSYITYGPMAMGATSVLVSQTPGWGRS